MGCFLCVKGFTLPSHQEIFGILVAETLACKCLAQISNKVDIRREIGIFADDFLEGTYSLLNQFSKLSEERIIDVKKDAYAKYQNHIPIEQAA